MRSQFMMLWSVAVCAFAACGESESDPASPTAGAAGIGNSAGSSSGGSTAGGNGGSGDSDAASQGGTGISVGDGPTYKDAVTADAWCAPDAGFLDLTACCNDDPCVGQCYEGEGKALQCECYGIVGGCKNGTVCCAKTLSCAAFSACYTK